MTALSLLAALAVAGGNYNAGRCAPGRFLATIACLGDSITYGTGTTAPAKTYPAQLTVVAKIPAANHGVGGEVVSQMRTRYDAVIKTNGYRWLVVVGGVNDILNGSTGASTYATLSAMYDDAISRSIRVVVVTVYPFDAYPGWSAGKQTELDSLNTSLRGYVSAHPTTSRLWDGYVDMGNAGIDAAALKPAYSYDGLHPNDAGALVEAQKIAAVIGSF